MLKRKTSHIVFISSAALTRSCTDEATWIFRRCCGPLRSGTSSRTWSHCCDSNGLAVPHYFLRLTQDLFAGASHACQSPLLLLYNIQSHHPIPILHTFWHQCFQSRILLPGENNLVAPYPVINGCEPYSHLTIFPIPPRVDPPLVIMVVNMLLSVTSSRF